MFPLNTDQSLFVFIELDKSFNVDVQISIFCVKPLKTVRKNAYLKDVLDILNIN